MAGFVHKFYRNYTTNGLRKYWSKKIDEKYWIDYLNTWNHPHREVISKILGTFRWFSLVEVGCGSGPNIVNIVKHFPNRQLGGVDVNRRAIEVASKYLKGAMLRVNSGDDIMLSDASTDVVLTDMMLIYVGPGKIKSYLKEMMRIARERLVLCEFHHEGFWERLRLRIFSGKHAYNYQKLLESLGCYDITIYKMPLFEADNDYKFRHVILAKLPKK